MEQPDILGPVFPPGTAVRYDGLQEGGPEYGAVIHCWFEDEIGGYDCYVAFFGKELPTGKPAEKPYILRYASTSLNVVDRDTRIEPQP
jgi:hypothetical protein